MRIAVLHQALIDEAAVDEHDVLHQRDAVVSALASRGHCIEVVECTLALDRVREALQSFEPQLIFNLVESLGGSDRLIAAVPLMLESLGLPYTGVPADALQLTSGKCLAKRFMLARGLPTLPWLATSEGLQGCDEKGLHWPSRWILKPIYEHASLGMSDDAVRSHDSLQELREALENWQTKLDRPCLAEPYIEGREFNVSLLGSSTKPTVLPIAEIRFVDYPCDKPRIVGFAAKWSESSAEYVRTPRTFKFAESDQPLLTRLRTLALDAWHSFGLHGYCRVDFRVDEQSQPWILEINANPCLSPDAGFPAAARQANIDYADLINEIASIGLRTHNALSHAFNTATAGTA
jgi:D-alanine-D-alanine ligase